MVKATGYTKAKILSEGTIVEDLTKRLWVIGSKLGEGGFGSIYTASEKTSKTFDKVIKIEPATNGPLYTEIQFYVRVCNEKEINNWISEKKLKFLGMPRYISGGKQPNSDIRYLVIDRFGSDLHEILMSRDLSVVCKMQISINILDVLEYIHSREYSHADIKALNILQGYKSSNEVYLLDFGMVSKFTNNGNHVPEKVDPKIKHNGTLEFCPRDSHRGLVSCRRSDIESLLFNLIFWLTWDRNSSNKSSRVGYGNLPWLSFIKNMGDKAPSAALLNQVADSKEKYMKDTKAFIKEVGLNAYSWSKHLVKILDDVSKIKYTEEPKYDEIRKDFVKIICECKGIPFSNHINMNSYREVDWKSVDVRQRKSEFGTQCNLPRKRASSDRDNDPIEHSSKKKKEHLLEVNNSSVIDKEPSKKKASKKVITKTTGKNKKNISQEFSSKENLDTSDEIIPKSALSKIPKKRTGKRSSSKENLEILETLKPKRAGKVKPTIISVDKVEKVSNCNGIIPGMKTLQKLKSQGATRSSPRNHNKNTPNYNSNNKNNNNNNVIISSNLNSFSVSCQTSPSLSVRF